MAGFTRTVNSDFYENVLTLDEFYDHDTELNLFYMNHAVNVKDSKYDDVKNCEHSDLNVTADLNSFSSRHIQEITNNSNHEISLSYNFNDSPETTGASIEITNVNDCNDVPNLTISNSDVLDDPYEQLSKFSKTHSKKIIFSHLNVNSLASKLIEIYEILQKGLTDIFFISETKLDDSYPNAQFNVPTFITHRLDRNNHGGGLICYVKESIPHKNRPDIAYNNNGIESIVIQVETEKANILFLHIYKPPNIHTNILNNAIEIMLNKCLLETKFIVIIGDLNVNFVKNPNQLTDLCDTFDLKQTVKNPTCFKSIENPSLLDVILTNCPKSLTTTINLPLGISDFHNYISAATKINGPSNEPKVIYYRSFKKFNNDIYLKDLQEAPFHVSQIFDDVDDQMWYHNSLLSSIIDRNAPRKQKTISFKQLPYMNDNLRKSINVKAALKRKYLKVNSQQNWSKYKQQRNLVNRLKRTSLQKYFHEKCNTSNEKGKHFWEIVKPFMTNNVKLNSQNITLYENGSLINNPTDVCNVFNKYYINVTNDLSESMNVKQMSADQVIDHYKNRPSITLINKTVNNNLNDIEDNNSNNTTNTSNNNDNTFGKVDKISQTRGSKRSFHKLTSSFILRQREHRATSGDLIKELFSPADTSINARLFGGRNAVEKEIERSKKSGYIIHPCSKLRYGENYRLRYIFIF